ncbi:hypothetical protein TCAL_07302 [Tigriopus californicus]|uniref:RRM domain-containing protein n=1 Tax=Tigriopus californicus TaxID=6832 RepID=A0A553PPP9_TIGCA|nr:heterogeneous nuclear ribonucleoprotein L-like [Tigriopus californicus]XP_059084853.1 heterogeneous nuclear ribonucleoprotein L-like [Tigriopus californicus]XP_059084854.1 heterogeneous nuclear ribonucleoprotein L-like [Tigriopus californicus]TRY79662.1 hypothetical protein TCAL_07302 [Tigriopus californicus]|eukprot:TCALIF_07302-PA protein Name:"Similar to HNRNPL Heterogeneous nuclear ribonucleoprotein L (Homo sapiens)" AED:0.06 eAED:0.06 QI:0/-1/0/1/-1/1/1/0/550
MALYAEACGHVAKRPRVDYQPSFQPTALHLAAAASTGSMAAALNASGAVPHSGILSQHYIEQQLNRKPIEPEKPNHILLFTVLNPTYPITCEVLNTICSPVGTVLRIVIFKKNGVQAMVEFDSIDTAKQAKESLHGCDIYSGCCTLKIEYAKPTKLNVYKNNVESWDYTNPNLGKVPAEPKPTPAPTVSQRPVLLKEPLAAPGATVGGNSMNNGQSVAPVVTSTNLVNGNLSLVRAVTGSESFENGFPTTHHSPPHMTSPSQQALAVAANGLETLAGQAAVSALASQATGASMIRGAATLLNGRSTAPSPVPGSSVSVAPSSGSTAVGGTPYQHHQGAVCMVYGLNSDKMNASRIFNLFCLYGNVVRIKFLKTKEGCAMVQMGDGLAVERVVSNLNNNAFFDTKMQLGFSKQAFLADVQSPYTLPDGSPSFQDFMGSKNNRFINPEMASKNRIQPPSKILHFFNTPPGLEADDIEEIFTKSGSPKPKCIKMFPSKTERSSSGLIEFETLSEALEGLVMCNHHPVPNASSKFPYIMKLCFSSSRSIPATIR